MSSIATILCYILCFVVVVASLGAVAVTLKLIHVVHCLAMAHYIGDDPEAAEDAAEEEDEEQDPSDYWKNGGEAMS